MLLKAPVKYVIKRPNKLLTLYLNVHIPLLLLSLVVLYYSHYRLKTQVYIGYRQFPGNEAYLTNSCNFITSIMYTNYSSKYFSYSGTSTRNSFLQIKAHELAHPCVRDTLLSHIRSIPLSLTLTLAFTSINQLERARRHECSHLSLPFAKTLSRWCKRAWIDVPLSEWNR